MHSFFFCLNTRFLAVIVFPQRLDESNSWQTPFKQLIIMSRELPVVEERETKKRDFWDLNH